MRLVCPCCGAIASLEAWENDGAVRQFIAAMSVLPHQVQPHASRYLGLFRKGGRGLAWQRALRIIQDLRDLVTSGTVHWEGGEVRPAPPELWARIMLQMIEAGKSELTDHNYLRKAVWSEAKALAARVEARANVEKRTVSNEQDEPFAPRGPKKRNCYTCHDFKPPSGCASGNRAVAGNLMAGCGKNWKERASAIGDLAGGIATAIKEKSDE